MTGGLSDLRASLAARGQEHLLRFADELSEAQRTALREQIESIDWNFLDPLIDRYVRNEPPAAIPADLEPAPYYPNNPDAPGNAHRGWSPQKYRRAGEELIRAGKIAAFTVAGGQGTRLGWNGPKGTFPATPVEGKPLFRIFGEQILANQEKYDIVIPWYIMTSPMNHEATRAFFADNNNFGLSRRSIFMFPQGMVPSFDKDTARILLAEKHEPAMNPDGHGGSIRALADSGAVEDMVARGIEHISYFQVDNPLVKVIDPVFIGLHAEAPDSSAQMSSKMLPKVAPEEKVGVFCRAGGKSIVIEYSDLPEALAHQRDQDGTLRFVAGSIAIHMIGVDFIADLTEGGEFRLPWHRALKKAPHIDIETGERIDPQSPNAVKLETFVFDAIPFAEKSIIYETSRIEEFAPIKNATGVDSARSSEQIQSDRNGAWLEQHGVEIERDDEGHVRGVIEISPMTALGPEDLEGVELPKRVTAEDRIAL